MASNVPFGIAGKIHENCILLQKKYYALLVRCPKWLFMKFNILEFKRGVEWSSLRPTNLAKPCSSKMGNKCPKFTARDLFPCTCSIESDPWSVTRKLEISVPNLPHGIYFHAHVVWNIILGIWVAVFTNFAATLKKRPAAASLAPRLNNWFHGKSKRKRDSVKTCVGVGLLFQIVDYTISRKKFREMIFQKFQFFFVNLIVFFLYPFLFSVLAL